VPTGRIALATLIIAAIAGCGDSDDNSSLTPANYSLEPLWTDRYHGFETPADLVATDGVVAVSGATFESATSDYLVRAYEGMTGTVLWQDNEETDCDFDGAADMVAGDGRLFATGRICSRYVLRAYDLQSGELLWQRRGPPGKESDASAVLLGNGIVVLFVAQDESSFIRALEPSSGRLIWEQASEALQASGTSDSRTIVTTQFISGTAQTYHQLLRAYDLLTGAPLWERDEVQGEAIGRIYELSASDGLFVSYVETRDDPKSWWLTGAETRTGAIVWQQSVSEHRFLETIIADADAIHTAGVQGIYDPQRDTWWNTSYVSALDSRSGTQLWEDQRGGIGGDQEVVSAALAGRRFATIGFEMDLRVFDAITGELAYEKLDPTFDGRGGRIAIDGDRIYTVAEGFEEDCCGSNILVQAYRESDPRAD